MNIEQIDLDVDIKKTVNEKRKITIDARASRLHYGGGSELFRINMDGKTLLRFNQNGDLIIHLSDYADYKYQLKEIDEKMNETIYELVPSERK